MEILPQVSPHSPAAIKLCKNRTCSIYAYNASKSDLFDLVAKLMQREPRSRGPISALLGRVLGIEITVQLSDSSVSFETKLSVQLGVGSFEHTPERYDMMSVR